MYTWIMAFCQSVAIRRKNEVKHCRMSKVMFVCFLVLMFLSTNFVPFWRRSTFLVYELQISIIQFYTCEDIKERRSNQSILKEISPGCSLEGLMLKLKFQYFGHLMRRVDSLEETLMLGGIGGRRRRGWQRMRWLDDITDSMDMSLMNSRSWWWTGRPGVLWFMASQRVRHDWATELNWRYKDTQISNFLQKIFCN